MATYYPHISGAVSAGMPYVRRMAFSTVVSESPAGQIFTAPRLTDPLWLFDLDYKMIPTADADEILEFFQDQRGRYGEFSFLDPAGTLIEVGDDFSDASWTKTGVTVGSAQTDPLGGSEAVRLTGTGGDNSVRTPILPAGDALTVSRGQALTFTGSIWIKPVIASQSFMVAFYRTGVGVESSKIIALADGRWQRIWFTWQSNTDDPLEVQFGGGGTWASNAVDVFAPVCSPLPGKGGDEYGPSNYGLHAKSRFAVDRLRMESPQPGLWNVKCAVESYA